MRTLYIKVLGLFGLVLFSNISFSTELQITVVGIHTANVSVLPFYMGVTKSAIFKKENVRNGETLKISIENEYLPGEFVVRYDYAQESGQNLYPSEQRIIVNNQNLVWKVNPIYCNNRDSTKFQKNEIENNILLKFNDEVNAEKEKIQVLHQFLMSYDKSSSDLMKLAEKEYFLRCNELNNKIELAYNKNKGTFARSFFQFSAIPNMTFSGDESKNIENLLVHYFDKINFKDSNIVNVVNFTSLLNNYVNLYAQSVKLTSQSQLDSVYAKIATNVLDIAKFGHPNVYGFVVDYFFLGFEKNNLTESMKAIFPYLEDPNCKTYQRLAIEKRIEGSKTLYVGTLSPNFEIGNNIMLHDYKTGSKYKLLLFWSADCSHCESELKELKPIYDSFKNKNILDVVAISIDETEDEIKKWENKIIELEGWKHIRPVGGIESEPCKKFFILSSPSMFLVNSITNEIVCLPKNSQELRDFLLKN